MFELIGVAAVAFTGGIIVGDLNKVTVDKAIAAIKSAEAGAAATLAKITAHKAA